MELSLAGLLSVFHDGTLALRRWQFGTKRQLGFLEDLYLLVNDGIPANRAVEMMAKLTRGLTHEVAVNIEQKISEGGTLADGMRDWFSPNIVEIISVGESGGALAETMNSAIKALGQRGVAVGAFVGALAYPLVVLTMACVIIVYLDSGVFQQFRQMKPVDQWPPAGQFLVEMSHFIKRWWWIIIATIVGVVMGSISLMKNYVGPLRPILDKYPPFSIYRKLVAARLLETLGVLVASGVVFKSALRVLQKQGNPYLSYHLALMEQLLSTGKMNIADVLTTGLVSEEDLMRLQVMAEVKGFEHGLIRMGVRGAENATATLKLVARILGGILLVAGGALIICIMQGIYLTGMAMGQG